VAGLADSLDLVVASRLERALAMNGAVVNRHPALLAARIAPVDACQLAFMKRFCEPMAALLVALLGLHRQTAAGLPVVAGLDAAKCRTPARIRAYAWICNYGWH